MIEMTQEEFDALPLYYGLNKEEFRNGKIYRLVRDHLPPTAIFVCKYNPEDETPYEFALELVKIKEPHEKE